MHDKSQRKEVPARPAAERIKDFFEVALGLDEKAARAEALRCLQCKKKPCVRGCPVAIDIPAFIRLIAEGDTRRSLKKIKEKNFLPAVCGRVCPQEDQCEAKCVLNKTKRPINIGALERFVADFGKEAATQVSQATERVSVKVAVVGSGPAGLTCAADLARTGYQVTLFESLQTPGGVLIYGIPEFRLPKAKVEEDVAFIRSLGVDVETNVLIGRTITIEDLFQDGFRAVFLGTGAGLPKFLGIDGENAAGVYSANEFLTRINLMKAYAFPEQDTPVRVGKRVAVVGAGNVALDSARSARRFGASVSLIYRRTRNEMPARRDEIANAAEEGIRFLFLTLPKRIIVDDQGCVRQLECRRMKLGKPDASGRPAPQEIEGSEFLVDVDTVILAVGQNPNPLVARLTPGLKTTKKGAVVVDAHAMTSIKGVFAGGDIVTGSATVISAMGAGKRAAKEMDQYIRLKEKK